MSTLSVNDINRLQRQLRHHRSKCQIYTVKPGIYKHHRRIADLTEALLGVNNMTHAGKLIHDHFIKLAEQARAEGAEGEAKHWQDRADALAKIGTKGDDNETA